MQGPQTMKQPTPEQALNALHQAARMAPLVAQDHEQLNACVRIIMEALKPKEDKKYESK